MATANAATETGEGLHDYEMVLILSPEVADEDIEVSLDKINRFITGNGGEVSDIERWGKRRLAYPIRHFTDGSYFLARFSMKPESGKELEVSLKISEEVIRHLLVRLDSQ